VLLLLPAAMGTEAGFAKIFIRHTFAPGSFHIRFVAVLLSMLLFPLSTPFAADFTAGFFVFDSFSNKSFLKL
jgi:hypothetical protein